MSVLLQFGDFLVLGVLATSTTVLAENDFFGSVGLISFGNVVEMPALSAL
jgi:hypothetical protein